MKKKTLQTSINLLIEAITYQRLRMSASQMKIPMSKIIREGIEIALDRIDKENNAIKEEKNDDHTTK